MRADDEWLNRTYRDKCRPVPDDYLGIMMNLMRSRCDAGKYPTVVPYTNYTNFTIGEKFRKFTERCNMMELYVFQNELLIIIPIMQPRH